MTNSTYHLWQLIRSLEDDEREQAIRLLRPDHDSTETQEFRLFNHL